MVGKKYPEISRYQTHYSFALIPKIYHCFKMWGREKYYIAFYIIHILVIVFLSQRVIKQYEILVLIMIFQIDYVPKVLFLESFL